MSYVFVFTCRETSIRAIALHPRLPYVAVGRQVRWEGGREGGTCKGHMNMRGRGHGAGSMPFPGKGYNNYCTIINYFVW